jgi:hypothetical protein
VKGGVNGAWQIETSPGLFVPYEGRNPWEQARDAKLALSDAMHEYAKERLEVPRPTKRRYFEQFDASVTIYPVLMPRSRVCRGGNYKAWVRSFPDTLECLNSRPLPVRSTWGIREWRTFAIDYLSLKPASLSEAIDVTVFQAHQSIEEYAAMLRRPEIAVLLPARGQELIGQNVIEKLHGPANVLLLGRSGLGKSFHFEHYRRICFEFDEVPILLYARYYQRDLNKAIHKSIGQYTRLTPAQLLENVKLLGKRPVLIVDGWNDSPEKIQSDLGDDLGAFQIRYNARLITASQTTPLHQLFGAATKIELDPLRQEHKQAIFAFHAGRQDESIPAHWCEPFSTAFDLRIAGQCQRHGASAETRAELYESYIRSAVPSVSARGVLRRLAWHMGENFKPALPIGDYERMVESFVQELGLPLSIADELLNSRLVAVDREIVTFEHELIRDHFRAEHLLRETQSVDLMAKLQEPKYAGLVEFVIPFLRDACLIRSLLERSAPDMLNKAFRGWLGSTAKDMIRDECYRLLAECRDRLADIEVEAWIVELDGGRRVVSGAFVVGSTCASGLDKKLCGVIANNLTDNLVRGAFLELLDLGEWALKEASARIARRRSMKPIAVFRQLVHCNVISSGSVSVHPLLFICQQACQMRNLRSNDSEVLPIREVLLKKVREGVAGTLALLLLMSDLRYSESIDSEDVLSIARQAWDTGFSTLRMEALDFIHSNSRAICGAGEQAETAVIALLDTFDAKDDIWLSTQWLATRSSFSGFETDIDTDRALREFRNILTMADAGDDPVYQLERESDPSMSFTVFAAKCASSALGNIFEDIFQGTYYEAYELLSDDERRKLLALALRAPGIDMFTDWYLGQLCKVGFGDAEDILIRYGSKIDSDTLCPQDSVSCYIMAHQAWAEIADEPIAYSDIPSEDHRVWAIVGELIFWLKRKNSKVCRVSFLLEQLVHFPRAVPDVLRQIGCSHKAVGWAPALQMLLAEHRCGIREALHESIKCDGSFTSVFRSAATHSTELFRWTISTLGDIGDRKTIAVLRPWTESSLYGKDAIRAIEQIEQRNIASRAQGSLKPI